MRRVRVLGMEMGLGRVMDERLGREVEEVIMVMCHHARHMNEMRKTYMRLMT